MEPWSKTKQLEFLRNLPPDESNRRFCQYLMDNPFDRRLCREVLLNALVKQKGRSFIGLYIKFGNPLPVDVEVKLIKLYFKNENTRSVLYDYLTLYTEQGNTFSDRALDEIRRLPFQAYAPYMYYYFIDASSTIYNAWLKLQKIPLEKRLQAYEKAKKLLPYKTRLKGANLDLVNFYQAFRLLYDEEYGGYQHYLDETLEKFRLEEIERNPDNPSLSRENFRVSFCRFKSSVMELIPQEDQDFLMQLI